jgi:DNA-directed RNA polymerase specialized sigma24 family protein
MERRYFETEPEVIWGLITYTDWWQPFTGSVITVGAARRCKTATDGIPTGMLATLDRRTELCRRMMSIPDRDRHLLFLWYVRQLPVDEIAQALGLSRRQCFRRRARAVRAIVEEGQPQEAA